MSDGTRVTGARAKGVSAAEKAKAGKPGKGNPYSDARPAMKAAWEEGFASVMDSEPAPSKPGSGFPGKKPKVKPAKAAAAESDEGPELSNAEISILLGGD